jgi:hypothetical protein
MPPLNLSPSLYRATADALTALGNAARIPVRLTSDEVHCVCYFGRTLAASLHGHMDQDELQGYGFTYGERGGPFSTDLQAGLDYLVAYGFVTRQPVIASDPLCLEEYLADDSLLEVAATLEDSSSGIEAGASFIVATVRCFLVRPVPLVYNAIHREPSLFEARIQEMRIGLPLPTRNEVLGAWLYGVSRAIDSHFPGRGTDPALLVPVVIDAFAALEPPPGTIEDEEEEGAEVEATNDDIADESEPHVQ